MKAKSLLLALALSMGLALGQTETKAGIGEEIKKAISTHQEKMNLFMEKVRALPREKQREFYQAEYPKPDETISSLSSLVEANPADPAILDAVTWIARTTRGSGLEAKDFANLRKHHLNHEKMGDVAMALAYSQEAEAQAFLGTVSEKSTSKKARGTALYALAIGMERDKTKAGEYDAITNKIINDYPDLEIRDRNIATALKAKKEAAVKFAIGKIAPEIIGKDVDGNEMKLSDYKGKIVVLDFWGDW
jgi:hypothetical protein